MSLGSTPSRDVADTAVRAWRALRGQEQESLALGEGKGQRVTTAPSLPSLYLLPHTHPSLIKQGALVRDGSVRAYSADKGPASRSSGQHTERGAWSFQCFQIYDCLYFLTLRTLYAVI